MYPKVFKFKKYSITYFCKEELKILLKEIFQNRIYDIKLKSDPTVFDLGAHIGLSTLYFKEEYPESKICCFEPNPNIFPLLEENISKNGLKNVVLHNVALGKSDTERDLYIDCSSYGAFSTASFRKNAWNGKQKSKPISVRVEKLSKYISKKVDLVKMDIEGAEKEVLEELDQSKSIKNILNMIIEYHPGKGNSILKLENILKRNGFDTQYYLDGKRVSNPSEELLLVVAKNRAKKS